MDMAASRAVSSVHSEVYAKTRPTDVYVLCLHEKTLQCAKEVLFRKEARIYNRYCGVDITVIPDQFLWQRLLPRHHDTRAAEAFYLSENLPVIRRRWADVLSV